MLVRSVAAMVAAAVLAAEAPSVPRASLNDRAEIVMSFPSTVLRKKEVRQQLQSGLTTAFVAAVTRQGKRIGAARIEVRYELWEEKMLVQRIEYDGRREKIALDSYDRLVEWWEKSAVRVARSGGSGAGDLQVRLDVLPFSAREADDAQRWLSDALGSGREADGAKSASALLDLIVGTSVQRRPILQYRWKVTVNAKGGG
jgi:hypothetical protein